MATIKYIAYAALFILVFFTYLYRQHWPLSILTTPLTALLTPFTDSITPYIQNPSQIITQIQEHVLGYTISGTFIGGIAVAITKWLGTKAKAKLKGEFDEALDVKVKELQNHASEIEKLTEERDTLQKRISLMSELLSKQEELLELERKNRHWRDRGGTAD